MDALRGAVMIVMALDHIRDFIHAAAMSFSPTDLTRTSAAIFFARWITHFCAPVFCFTAGIGAYLWVSRGRTRAQLSRFLVTRGLWLIVLELTLLRFIFFFNDSFRDSLILLVVIWMLGASMLILAALVHLPVGALAALSVAVVAGHNLLDPVDSAQFGALAWLWDLLHGRGAFRVGSNTVRAAYVLIPWFAVMSAGYCFGPVLRWDAARRRKFLWRLGLGMCAAFVLLRGWNQYGDPAPWSVQHSALFTALSFLNCTKYPPSLDFLLMTLGPALLAMIWLDARQFSPKNPLIVFGRVPFFYFVVHLAAAHLIAVGLACLRYGNQPFLWIPPPSMGGAASSFPPGYGYPLWVVYAVWIGIVVALYPACLWFSQLKDRRKDWWLSYL